MMDRLSGRRLHETSEPALRYKSEELGGKGHHAFAPGHPFLPARQREYNFLHRAYSFPVS